VVVENAMVEDAVVVENEVAAVPGEKAREEANGDEEGATVVEEEEEEGETVAQEGRAAEASPTTLAHQRGGSCSLTASPIAGRMQQTATYATSSLLQLAGV